MNDAKNDNLNDPPGFPGKILKVGDFARAMTSFWSKKAPKLIQWQKIRPRERVYPYDIIVHNGGLEQY